MNTDQETLFERLAMHVAIFERIYWRNRSSDDQTARERGEEAGIIAADLREAMAFIRSHESTSRR